MTTISVAQPRFWWRATASDLKHRVPEDPDSQDNRPARWAHITPQPRWEVVALAVATVGDSLARRDWVVDDDEPGLATVTVPNFPADLTNAERSIVDSWFSPGEVITCDPWEGTLTDGRHRLWGTLPYFADRLVPLRSDALAYYASAAAFEHAKDAWGELIDQHLDDLDQLPWFPDADPVNVTFRGAIVHATERLPLSPTDTTIPDRAYLWKHPRDTATPPRTKSGARRRSWLEALGLTRRR